MANTYTNIQSSYLNSSSASVTFSNIPQTYQDLLLRVSARNSADGTGNVLLQYNNSSTGYSRQDLSGSASGGVTASRTTASYITAANLLVSGTAISSTYSNIDFYICSYVSNGLSFPRTGAAMIIGGSATDVTSQEFNTVSGNAWDDSSAITSIVVTPSTGSFAAGSSFYLYGIKKS